MKKNNLPKTKLQRQAEAKSSKSEQKKSTVPGTDTLHLVRELQMHQIELEAQNEELQVRVEMEAALRQCTTLYDFAPIGYFILRRDGTIHQANLSGGDLLGMNREELVEQRFEQFVSAEFCSVFDSFLETVFWGHRKETCEIKLLKNKREPIWVRIDAACPDALFQQGICHLVVSDITEHKRAENILQARFRITEFATEHPLNDLLQNALDELCALTDSPIGFFHFVEPDQHTLSLQAWSTRTLKEMCSAEGKGLHYDIDQAGLWADCVREGRPVIHNDYASLPASHRKGLPKGHAPVNREMVFPITRNQKIVAIIGVGNKLVDYTEDDLAYASRLADLIWDITEHKRAEEALRKSEERYKRMFEDSPISLWEEDFSQVKAYFDDLRASGITDFRAYFGSHPEAVTHGAGLVKVLDVNQATLTLLEGRDKEILLAGLSKVFVDKEMKVFREELITMAEGGQKFESDDEIHRTLTGKEKFVTIHTSVAPGYEHSLGKVLVSLIDVTEHKRVEEALRKSEARYHSIVEDQTELICRYLPDGRLSFVNQAYTRYYDETAQRLINTNFIPQIPEPDMSTVINKISEITPQEPCVAYEHRIIKPDGEIRWQRWTHRGIYDADGNLIEHQAVGNDITERKRAEEALQASQQQLERQKLFLEAMLSAIPIPVFYKDAQGRYLGCNRAYTEVMGIELTEFKGKTVYDLWPHELAETYHRMDLELFENLGPQIYEAKVRSKSGEMRDVIFRKDVFRNEDGSIGGIVGTHFDITERKQTEERIAKERENFLKIFSAAPVGLLLLDDNTVITKANQSVADMILRNPVDIIGKRAGEGWSCVNSQESPKGCGFGKNCSNCVLRQGLESVLAGGPSIQGAEIALTLLINGQFQKRWLSIGAEPIELDGNQHIVVAIDDITERKQAEENLRLLNERFHLATRAANLGVWDWDIQKNELTWDDRMYALYGVNKADFRGEYEAWISGLHPDDVARCAAETEQALRGEREYDTEFRVVWPDGATRYLKAHGQVVRAADGTPLRMTGINDDITEHKQSEEKLHRYLSELKVLYDNGLAISALLEPREIGRKIIGTLSRNLSWHHIVIRLRRGETDNLELIAFNQPNLSEQEAAEAGKRFSGLVTTVDQGLSGWCVRTGQAIRTGNVREHPQYVDSYSGTRSGVYMPLKVGERVIGCISVESEDENAFTEQDERLLATLAAQTAIAFENARLYQDIQQELQERERAEAALANEKEFTETALDSQRDTFFVFEVSDRTIRWNRIFRDTTGYSNEEIALLKAPDSYFSPDDLEKITSFTKTIMLDRNGRIELNLVCKDGRKIPTEYEVSLIQDKTGETNYIIAVGRDITERKQAEEQIQLLAKFPAEDPNPVLRVAGDGDLLYINEAGLRHLPQWNLQVGKAVPSLLWEAVSQSMQNGTTQTLDLEHGKRLFAFYVAPILSAGYANLYGHDITESRQVKALQDAKARYQVLFQQSPYGVLLADLNTGMVIEANEIASRQLGYTRKEFAKLKIFDFEASEKPEQIAQHMQKIVSEGRDDFETLHHTKSGEIRNVHVWVKTLQMNDGVLFYAIVQDITERKQMEDANEAYNREITLLEERQRIASDLHDAVSQTLFSARLATEMLMRQPDRQADVFTRSLINLHRLVRSASGELRLILVELRNNALLNVSLETLLANLLDSGMARTNANLIFQCLAGDLVLSAKIKLAFYRIAQEATSNAIKHGKPDNIQCTLRDNEQTLEMLVQDDGLGFSEDKVSDDHFGLQIMRERAEQAGLKLIVTSQPGKGTSVAVCWEREQ